MEDFINKDISDINSKFFAYIGIQEICSRGLIINSASYIIPIFGWKSCLCYVDSNNKSLISLLRIQWEK